MTTVYNDYYSAYKNNQFDINNVNFITKLCMDTYVPDPAHKRNNINAYVVMTAGHLTKNHMTTLPISQILDRMKQNIKDDIVAYPDSIFVELKALFADDTQKQTDLIMAFSNTDLPDYQYWQKLIQLGIKYVVVQSPNLNINCFCETLI